MSIRWPPSPLGLGTPLNLALISPHLRRRFRGGLWLVPVLGILIPLLMLAIDHLFFGSESLERVRQLGSESLAFRFLLVIYSSVTEEVIFRLLISSLIAWLAYLALKGVSASAKPVAEWLGILVAALVFGLAHVSNLSRVPHPVLRAVIINGIAGIILGWIYWRRGLETSIFTHGAAIVVLYIAVPVFL